MKALIEAGHVYVAQPPLYSTLVGNSKIYLKDDLEQARFIAEHPNHTKEFQRLKGLGEMDFTELRDTTIDPSLRALLQVTMEQASIADDICSILMGDDVDQRRTYIQTHAKDVRFLDI
jgi:DNA gyrase subunit B